jgi:hypothetical protein
MKDVCAECTRTAYCMYPCEEWLEENESRNVPDEGWAE